MDLPEAHWSRGEVTTTMMKFIPAFLEDNVDMVRGNETYELMVARQPLEFSIQGMYLVLNFDSVSW